MNRESWLTEAVNKLRPDFDRLGFPLPGGIRVTCGWPSKSALSAKRKRVGECWSPDCSKDGHHEIFISPCLADPVEALGVLVHEAVHAAVGVEAGHKGPFRDCAVAIGLEGKMTSTTVGDALKVRLEEIIEEIGDYDHAELDKLKSNAPPKQGTRMLLVKCPKCQYQVRTTKKWLGVGVPTCPCGMLMEAEDNEERTDGDE